MEKQNIPWEAISAKLNNCADPEQIRQIQDWLDLSSDNPIILSEIMQTWSLTRNKTEFYQPDMSLNWQKLMKRINYQPKQKLNSNIYFRWIAAAAVLILVFLAGIQSGDGLFRQKAKVTYTKIIAPEGNKTQVILPDSSYVWLNSGSELQYASDYSAKNREVQMKGECFFDVVKDPAHPFLVRGSKFNIKVFGTRFNVNEDNAKEMADVTLVSGKVQVLTVNNKLISEIKPGEQLVFGNGKYTIQKAENLESLTAWMNNMMIFDNKPLEEVINCLEHWYGVRINIEHTMYYKHNYTFKVKTESLREVLELISVITPIDYQIDGEKVTIKYTRR
jgi:ferric-dicitrate binding protein FerR (iron transport regulator)